MKEQTVKIRKLNQEQKEALNLKLNLLQKRNCSLPLIKQKNNYYDSDFYKQQQQQQDLNENSPLKLLSQYNLKEKKKNQFLSKQNSPVNKTNKSKDLISRLHKYIESPIQKQLRKEKYRQNNSPFKGFLQVDIKQINKTGKQIFIDFHSDYKKINPVVRYLFPEEISKVEQILYQQEVEQRKKEEIIGMIKEFAVFYSEDDQKKSELNIQLKKLVNNQLFELDKTQQLNQFNQSYSNGDANYNFRDKIKITNNQSFSQNKFQYPSTSIILIQKSSLSNNNEELLNSNNKILPNDINDDKQSFELNKKSLQQYNKSQQQDKFGKSFQYDNKSLQQDNKILDLSSSHSRYRMIFESGIQKQKYSQYDNCSPSKDSMSSLQQQLNFYGEDEVEESKIKEQPKRLVRSKSVFEQEKLDVQRRKAQNDSMRSQVKRFLDNTFQFQKQELQQKEPENSYQNCFIQQQMKKKKKLLEKDNNELSLVEMSHKRNQILKSINRGQESSLKCGNLKISSKQQRKNNQKQILDYFRYNKIQHSDLFSPIINNVESYQSNIYQKVFQNLSSSSKKKLADDFYDVVQNFQPKFQQN